MQTIYIDVYFLINFTVDLLALYFASKFTKIYVTARGLIISAVLSAIAACFAVLFIESRAYFFLALIVSGIVLLTPSLKGSLTRRLKFLLAFMMFLVIVGGLVYFFFLTLERWMPPVSPTENNRSLLLLAVVLLLSIGIIKILLAVFVRTPTERSARLEMEFSDRVIVCDAFIDSGNLLLDPADMAPVIIVKQGLLLGLFENKIPKSYLDIPENLKSMVRLVPVDFGDKKEIRIGLRPKHCQIKTEKGIKNVKITVIIDENGGAFAGCEALAPISILENL